MNITNLTEKSGRVCRHLLAHKNIPNTLKLESKAIKKGGGTIGFTIWV